MNNQQFDFDDEEQVARQYSNTATELENQPEKPADMFYSSFIPSSKYHGSSAESSSIPLIKRQFYRNEYMEDLNDQLEKAKNDLTHEANYKLSKVEQENENKLNRITVPGTGIPYPFVDVNDLQQTQDKQLQRRDLNADNEIRLKISRNLMAQGHSASLPSDANEENNRFYHGNDIINRELYNDHHIGRKILAMETDNLNVNFYKQSEMDQEVPYNFEQNDRLFKNVNSGNFKCDVNCRENNNNHRKFDDDYPDESFFNASRSEERTYIPKEEKLVHNRTQNSQHHSIEKGEHKKLNNRTNEQSKTNERMGEQINIKLEVNINNNTVPKSGHNQEGIKKVGSVKNQEDREKRDILANNPNSLRIRDK